MRTIGTVRWFDDLKGFGFIAIDDEKAHDVFVHYTMIRQQRWRRRTLLEGQHVELDVAKDERGRLHARDLVVVGAAPTSAPAAGQRSAPRAG